MDLQEDHGASRDEELPGTQLAGATSCGRCAHVLAIHQPQEPLYIRIFVKRAVEEHEDDSPTILRLLIWLFAYTYLALYDGE